MSSQASLSQLLAVCDAAAYVVDRERRVLYWNAAAEKLTGIRETQVLGRWCTELPSKLAEDDPAWTAGLPCASLEPLNEKPALSAPTRRTLTHKDGTEIESLVIEGRIDDPRGRPFALYRVWCPQQWGIPTLDGFATANHHDLFDPGNRLATGWLRERILIARQAAAASDDGECPVLRFRLDGPEPIDLLIASIESAAGLTDDVLATGDPREVDLVVNNVATGEDLKRMALHVSERIGHARQGLSWRIGAVRESVITMGETAHEAA